MASAETIELPKAEYEALLQRSEDLDDLLAVMESDRSGARIPHPVARAIGEGGNPVKAFRVHIGLSLRELARRAGLSPGYLSQIERGIKPGSVAVLSRIARELGTTIDALTVERESDLG